MVKEKLQEEVVDYIRSKIICGQVHTGLFIAFKRLLNVTLHRLSLLNGLTSRGPGFVKFDPVLCKLKIINFCISPQSHKKTLVGFLYTTKLKVACVILEEPII